VRHVDDTARVLTVTDASAAVLGALDRTIGMPVFSTPRSTVQREPASRSS
jgi:hypothetical protein